MINATKREKKKVYVMIASRLFRYGSPNCWWQVKQSKDFNDSDVPNHIQDNQASILCLRTVIIRAWQFDDDITTYCVTYGGLHSNCSHLLKKNMFKCLEH